MELFSKQQLRLVSHVIPLAKHANLKLYASVACLLITYIIINVCLLVQFHTFKTQLKTCARNVKMVVILVQALLLMNVLHANNHIFYKNQPVYLSALLDFTKIQFLIFVHLAPQFAANVYQK